MKSITSEKILTAKGGDIKTKHMKLYSINTGYFKLDGGAMFGVVPKSGLPRPLRRRGSRAL